MTAQHTSNAPIEEQPETDPLGPIVLPGRSRVGARALALVGSVSLVAVGVAALTETSSTWPTID
jgi:hypothetical protein